MGLTFLRKVFFIKAVAGFCLSTMQILFKNFKKYLNQIADLKNIFPPET